MIYSWKWKIRYKLSPYYYIVDSIDNFKAAIMAKDGSIKSVPLYRIVKLKPSETRIQFAETIDGTSRGIIDEIVDYNTKNKSAKVKFILAGKISIFSKSVFFITLCISKCLSNKTSDTVKSSIL